MVRDCIEMPLRDPNMSMSTPNRFSVITNRPPHCLAEICNQMGLLFVQIHVHEEARDVPIGPQSLAESLDGDLERRQPADRVVESVHNPPPALNARIVGKRAHNSIDPFNSFCRSTASNHRSNFHPTFSSTPTRRNPNFSCSRIPAAFAESPTTATICRSPISSHSAISRDSSVRPKPRPS